mmetsp:Transcript_11910/g.22032  ORF Transcript_11910/g.22032 Transcript_11910/m.22032 type:complete len:205 (-) Transcript_11910:157-771(-)
MYILRSINISIFIYKVKYLTFIIVLCPYRCLPSLFSQQPICFHECHFSIPQCCANNIKSIFLCAICCVTKSLQHLFSAPTIKSTFRSEILHQLFQLILIRPRKLIHRLLILGKHKRRHGRNFKLAGRILIVVHINLAKCHIGIFFGKFVINGRDHFAWRAPFCGEIHYRFRVDGAELFDGVAVAEGDDAGHTSLLGLCRLNPMT